MIVEIGEKILKEGGIGERKKIDWGKNKEREDGNGWEWKKNGWDLNMELILVVMNKKKFWRKRI